MLLFDFVSNVIEYLGFSGVCRFCSSGGVCWLAERARVRGKVGGSGGRSLCDWFAWTTFDLSSFLPSCTWLASYQSCFVPAT